MDDLSKDDGAVRAGGGRKIGRLAVMRLVR